jgi:folate-binding protein YgfZ
MSKKHFYRLDRITVLDVRGADALAIVHNLTTNEVKSLDVGAGCESFITDVRGKMLGHIHLYREDEFLRMIGPAGPSERIAQHVDRYTIREDAVPVVRDDEFVAIVLPRDSATIVCGEPGDGEHLSKSKCQIGDAAVDLYWTRWLGEGTAVLLVPSSRADGICDQLAGQSISMGDDSEFHHLRLMAAYPWFGIDLDESNLPQEADRDSLAISFTKGCYLGQETVARLDALGQVQKKLVRWSIPTGIPEAGATLARDGKKVGRLTSVSADGRGGANAIGFARRSHFDSGATATGVIEATAAEFTGVVV